MHQVKCEVRNFFLTKYQKKVTENNKFVDDCNNYLAEDLKTMKKLEATEKNLIWSGMSVM